MDKLSLKHLVEKTKKLKILYVEDNQETRNQAVKVFENFLDHIDIAIDGLDGLTQYKQKTTNYYDLIISDINMPNMNGMDMSEEILKINNEQHILIITAHNNPEYLQELINIGITNYIHKPVRMDNLIQAFAKVIDIFDKKNQANQEFNKISKLNHELDALVDSFDTYVIASRTDLKGKITYASKAYEIISGYKESELIGQPHSIVRHPDMPSLAFKQLWDTIKKEKLWIGEVKNLKKDGTFYWVEAHIAPYYNANGEHIGYSAIRLDITSKKRAELLNNEIINLLDNAGQGFLSFGKDFKLNQGFSKECLNIFNKIDIFNENISELLFFDDSIKKDLFEDGISRVMNTTDDMMKELFLSLLPKEHIINNKDIKIKYKFLQNNIVMIILTDITNTKKLESKIIKQNQVQKMIVSVASNKNDFIDIKNEFDNFILNIPSDLTILKRELHTFKGVFAQKEMVYITNSIHQLESKIIDKSIIEIKQIFQKHNLKKIFEKDLLIISSILGEEFITEDEYFPVDINSFEILKEKLEIINSQLNNNLLNDIIVDFNKLKDDFLYSLLNVYPPLVKKMALSLNKEIYPLTILGDKSLKIPNKFKPFIKSLIHLFNNCVEHGIETSDCRIDSSKNEFGTIKCNFKKEQNNIKIIISDDGQGIDTNKLLLKAISTNTIMENQINILSEEEKLFLVFKDNLSTKENISMTSGRGVGMSAIKSELEKLNGDIKINNSINNGVEFIFTLPINKIGE